MEDKPVPYDAYADVFIVDMRLNRIVLVVPKGARILPIPIENI